MQTRLWKPKTCSCCGQEWHSKEEFRRMTTFVAVWEEFGVVLFNCMCKTTVSIELYEGSIKAAISERRSKMKVKEKAHMSNISKIVLTLLLSAWLPFCDSANAQVIVVPTKPVVCQTRCSMNGICTTACI